MQSLLESSPSSASTASAFPAMSHFLMPSPITFRLISVMFEYMPYHTHCQSAFPRDQGPCPSSQCPHLPPHPVLSIQQVLSVSRCSVRVRRIEVSSTFAMSHHQSLRSHHCYFHVFVLPPRPQNCPTQGISRKEQTPDQTSPTQGRRSGKGRREG